MAEAIEAATKTPIVVWSQFQECTGCTVNLLQNTAPDPAQLILQQISLAYLETAMATAGAYNEKGENYTELSLNQALEKGAIWIVEGSIATKIPYAMSIAGKTSWRSPRRSSPRSRRPSLSDRARASATCRRPSPTPPAPWASATSFARTAASRTRRSSTCRAARATARTSSTVLTYILVNGKAAGTRRQGRPLFLYGQTIHDNCQRRGHFEAGEFVEVYGDEGSAKEWCLYKVGCKGPVTYAPCAVTRWNGRVSWCNASGGPVHGLLGEQLLGRLPAVLPAGPQLPRPGHRQASVPQTHRRWAARRDSGRASALTAVAPGRHRARRSRAVRYQGAKPAAEGLADTTKGGDA